MKFEVQLEGCFVKEYKLEANSEEEAKKKAEEMFAKEIGFANECYSICDFTVATE